MSEGGLEDVVELGFEGFDRITDKYYDKVHDRIRRKGSKKKDRDDHHRSRSEPRDERKDYRDDRDDMDRRDYGHDGRRSERDLDRRSRDAGDDSFYPQRQPPDPRLDPRFDPRGQAAVQPYGNTYPVPFPPAPEPPYVYPAAPAASLPQQPRSQPTYPPEEDSIIYNRRRQSRERSRRSPSDSPSPPRRRSRNFEQPPPSRDRRRKRSKSPSGKGLASGVLGAVAGGLAGHELNKGDKLTTVAAAVIGALGAREAEKQWDKRKRSQKDDDEKWERRFDKDRDRR